MRPARSRESRRSRCYIAPRRGLWVSSGAKRERCSAGSHGCDYTSRVAITPKEGKNYLSMTLEAKTNAFMGKLMMFFMGWMFVGMAKKAFLKDLQDIKAKVEFNH
jgi:hypothetical protein